MRSVFGRSCAPCEPKGITWDEIVIQASAGETIICRIVHQTRISLRVMRILFVGPSRIGDAVLASGLLNHLIAQYPEARFTVACGVAAAPLFAAVPGLEQLIAMEKQPRAGHWWQLWKQVAGRRWSMVVDLRRSVIPWVVVTRRRAIAPPSSQNVEHAVVSFARTLGLNAAPPSPRVWSGPSHLKSAATLVPGDSPVLAIGPTANWAGKTWRAERFLDVIQRITAQTPGEEKAFMPGARIAVFGAASEREIAQPIIDALPDDRCIDLVGQVDLPTAAACLQRCAFYIGNDSGLMHIAAASGVPTLGLFGPSLPERYAPWGLNTAWVRTRKSLSELVETPNYDYDATGTLMDSLSVEDVLLAAHDLWQRRVSEGA
jgi:heptosyltransferase-3